GVDLANESDNETLSSSGMEMETDSSETQRSVTQYAASLQNEKLWESQHSRATTVHDIQPDVQLSSSILNLPTDKRRPLEPSLLGAEINGHLAEPLRKGLMTLAHKNESSLANVVLTAWCLLLSRLTGQDTIVVDAGHAATGNGGSASVPLLLDLSGEPDTVIMLARVQSALATLAHHSFDKEGTSPIPGKAKFTTAVSRAAFYSYDNEPVLLPAHPLLVYHDLEVHLVQHNEEAIVKIRYSTALYHNETVQRYLGYLEAICACMVANNTQPVSTFEFLSSEERTLLLETWNETDKPYPRDRCVHDLFVDQVEKTPDAIAVIHEDRSVTYRELNALADKLVSELVHRGIAPGDRVAIMLARSLELVVAQLAILKAGCAFVPIDVAAPLERQMYIMSDSGAKLLITEAATAASCKIPIPTFIFDDGKMAIDLQGMYKLTTVP
ncbi:hypothetical protein BGW42_006749, partial [Actinomortierella wolfii]